MALFSRRKKSGSGICTEDEILGFIDDVVRNRQKLTISSKKITVVTSVYSVDDKNKIIRVQNDPELEYLEDQAVICGFSLDRTWYVFKSKVITHEGRIHVTLPEEIQRKERRKSNRTTISLREKVKVAALEGLGTGIGVTGMAVDVGTGGICMAIERAMVMQNEREVNPGYNLLDEGTELMIVKVNRLPGIPPFEVPGIVNRIDRVGKWRLAIQFSKMPGKTEALIKNLLDSRRSPVRTVRRSRKRRMEMDAARKKEEAETATEAAVEAKSEALDEPVTPEETPPSNNNRVTFTPLKTQPSSPATAETQMTESQDSPVSTPAAAPIEPPTPPEPPEDCLLSLGDELDKHLDLLKTKTTIKWLHVDNPLRIVRNLNEKHPRFLLLPLKFREQSMLDYLQKIAGMGVLKEVKIILLSDEEIPMREIVKSKMLGIKHMLKLPLENPDQLLEIINTPPQEN